MAEDWPRPVVHWEIVARNPDVQVEFYRRLCHWHIGDGPIRWVDPGLGGPESGPAGHFRQGEHPSVTLYVQVRDLGVSLAMVPDLGGRIIQEPFDVPEGPTLAGIEDPEGNPVVLVQQ
jgi:predicted enzyme related to lactoylglutathione lyase